MDYKIYDRMYFILFNYFSCLKIRIAAAGEPVLYVEFKIRFDFPSVIQRKITADDVEYSIERINKNHASLIDIKKIITYQLENKDNIPKDLKQKLKKVENYVFKYLEDYLIKKGEDFSKDFPDDILKTIYLYNKFSEYLQCKPNDKINELLNKHVIENYIYYILYILNRLEKREDVKIYDFLNELPIDEKYLNVIECLRTVYIVRNMLQPIIYSYFNIPDILEYIPKLEERINYCEKIGLDGYIIKELYNMIALMIIHYICQAIIQQKDVTFIINFISYVLEKYGLDKNKYDKNLHEIIYNLIRNKNINIEKLNSTIEIFEKNTKKKLLKFYSFIERLYKSRYKPSLHKSLMMANLEIIEETKKLISVINRDNNIIIEFN